MKNSISKFYLLQFLTALFTFICGITLIVTTGSIGAFVSDGGIVFGVSDIYNGGLPDTFFGGWTELLAFPVIFLASFFLQNRGKMYRGFFMLLQVAAFVFSVEHLRLILVFCTNYSVSATVVFGNNFLYIMNYLKIILQLAMCVFAAIMLLKKGWEKSALK